MEAKIRKTCVIVEETQRDMGRTVDPPTRKAAALAVIKNPAANKFQEDLAVLSEIGAELGELLGKMCVEALGIKPEEAESYGKAAIVGENGEWEHAAAVLHPKLGGPLRKEVEKGAALVPSVKKMGGPGASIDVPLGHKDAAYVRSHFDGMEVRLADAPRANEILVAIAVTDSGRPFPRVGGLTVDEMVGEDGLR
ncbi:MAG: amino acid synthesis family protein [Pseudomonadota bacterium]|nr:amino acid synthesis family protein [Pseudomonadota bacterium]